MFHVNYSAVCQTVKVSQFINLVLSLLWFIKSLKKPSNIVYKFYESQQKQHMVYELRYLCKRQHQKFRENYDKALILFLEMLPPFTQYARANLKKVNTSQLLLPQHQSTYPRGPESASIEIPSIRPQFIKFSKNCFLYK